MLQTVVGGFLELTDAVTGAELLVNPRLMAWFSQVTDDEREGTWVHVDSKTAFHVREGMGAIRHMLSEVQ